MIEANPFDELIVNEPRRQHAAVPGLNEAPLRGLLALFGKLEAGMPPRTQRRLPQACLVTSAQPGFGKSHLIARLFRELLGRATTVYVRPFQNASLGFQSLLATTVRELNTPERTGFAGWRPNDPTQLDLLAFHVFGHLVADCLEWGEAPNSEQIAELRTRPVEAFGQGLSTDLWGKWMRDTFDTNLTAYHQALGKRNVELHSPDWLRVLFAYAFSYPNQDIRQSCLDWIVGYPLSIEQGAAIGLRTAELLGPEATADELNESSRCRLLDLLRLACFYRPFVFCFDQTEAYGHSNSLARSLGMLVAALVNDAHNHLTLITSNQAPWLKTISPHFEDADRERIAHPPLALEGLTKAQGETLVRLRAEADAPQETIKALLDPAWLVKLFPSERARMATRQFLQKCKERWEELQHRPPPPVPSLSELYEERRQKLLANPKRLFFDADALEWLVKVCAKDLAGLKTETAVFGYFTVSWETPRGRVIFGFEAGSNWKRWQAIAQEAGKRAAQQPPLKAVFFRDFSQPTIPGVAWQIADELNRAKATHLHLLILSREDLAELYAGYDLYSEALGDDIAPHTSGSVLEYLHTRFAKWWTVLQGPIDPSAPPTLGPSLVDPVLLSKRVREIVETVCSLPMPEVIEKLGVAVTSDEVLSVCQFHAEIEVRVANGVTILEWQSKSSD